MSDFTLKEVIELTLNIGRIRENLETKDSEIERLKVLLTTAEGIGELRLNDLREQRKRIEELEQLLDAKYEDIQVWMHSGKRRYHITDDQIRAAVKKANKVAAWGTSGAAPNTGGWETLKPLGIERCDCFCGHKTHPNKSASATDGGTYDETRPCPDCNGDGWVKK